MNRAFIIKLSALCLLMTLPLWAILAWKWPISTDLISYATAAKVFSTQFWAGELYPRWLVNTNAGFGSPVFLFYNPLAFYVMSFFEFIAPIDPHGFGRVFIGIMCAIIVSGLTSYRWLKQHLAIKTAEKGALLYAGFPYLLLHIYGGFAISQLWGIALFPLLMEAAEDTVHKGWRMLPKFALAYALLCCIHLPSMLMFAGIPWLYVVVFAPAGQKAWTVALATGSALLGIALSMIYLLPALFNKPYIASQHYLGNNFGYSHDFLDTYSQLGLLSMIMPLVVLFFEIPKSDHRTTLTAQVRFWLVVQAGLMFMTLPLSKPIWDALPPLQYLQFPFRFFLAMLPGTVFIALHWLPHAKSKYAYKMLFVIGLICSAIYSEQLKFFARESPITTILDNNLVAPEYQTRWMEVHKIDFHRNVPDRFKAMRPVTFITGKGSASITMQDSRHMTLHVNITSRDATLALHQFYFPGWQATPPAEVLEQDALLSLHTPKGNYDIRLNLPWYTGEREGMIVSLGALGIVLSVASCSLLVASNKVKNAKQRATSN